MQGGDRMLFEGESIPPPLLNVLTLYNCSDKKA